MQIARLGAFRSVKIAMRVQPQKKQGPTECCRMGSSTCNGPQSNRVITAKYDGQPSATQFCLDLFADQCSPAKGCGQLVKRGIARRASGQGFRQGQITALLCRVAQVRQHPVQTRDTVSRRPHQAAGLPLAAIYRGTDYRGRVHLHLLHFSQ
jgi:hypothetical protein